VAFATTGPGATHLFTAVAAAWQDSSPIVFVVGQVKSNDSSRLNGIPVRQNGTFEFDSYQSFSPICKKVYVPSSPSEAVLAIDDALKTCISGRPGPVLIELPLDIQGAQVPSYDSQPPQREPAQFSSEFDYTAEEEFRKLLISSLSLSSRPLFLIGSGCVRANVYEQLTDLLDQIGMPYVVTQFARQAGRIEHDLYLGSPGVKANRSANLAVAECDLLVAIGTSLHQQVTGWDGQAFSNLPSRKIWTEIDSDTTHARQSLVDKAFPLSSEQVLSQLLSIDHGIGYRELERTADWKKRCLELRTRFLLHYPSSKAETDRMCLYKAVSVLSEFSKRIQTITTDAGLPWYAVAQHYFPSQGSAYISSGSFGSMGMALPFAIGAAHAKEGKVVAFTGDGSLMTCVQELATLRESMLNVILIVSSNEGYGSIKSTQDRFFDGRRMGTDSSNGVWIPSMAGLAKVFEIPFFKCRNESELRDVFNRLTSDEWVGPAMVEVMTLVEQKIEPFVASSQDKQGKFRSGSLSNMLPEIDGVESV
jgi:acetolactate synthase-1/2/3 large subunit